MAPVSRSTACSGWQASRVRPSFILGIRASGSLLLCQSSLESFLPGLLAIQANQIIGGRRLDPAFLGPALQHLAVTPTAGRTHDRPQCGYGRHGRPIDADPCALDQPMLGQLCQNPGKDRPMKFPLQQRRASSCRGRIVRLAQILDEPVKTSRLENVPKPFAKGFRPSAATHAKSARDPTAGLFAVPMTSPAPSCRVRLFKPNPRDERPVSPDPPTSLEKRPGRRTGPIAGWGERQAGGGREQVFVLAALGQAEPGIAPSLSSHGGDLARPALNRV